VEADLIVGIGNYTIGAAHGEPEEAGHARADPGGAVAGGPHDRAGSPAVVSMLVTVSA
jgi:hypothetical protein